MQAFFHTASRREKAPSQWDLYHRRVQPPHRSTDLSSRSVRAGAHPETEGHLGNWLLLYSLLIDDRSSPAFDMRELLKRCIYPEATASCFVSDGIGQLVTAVIHNALPREIVRLGR